MTLLAAGCGGRGSATLPPPAQALPVPSPSVPVLPSAGHAVFAVVSLARNAPKSVRLVVDGGPPKTFDVLGNASHECAQAGDTVQCAFTVEAVEGEHTFDLSTFGGAAGSGPRASSNAGIPFSVGEAGAVVPIAIGGSPAALKIFGPTDPHVTAFATGYDVVGNAPLRFTVVPTDAAGHLILGAAAPQVTVSAAGGVTVARSPEDTSSFTVTSLAESPERVRATVTARTAGVPDAVVNLALSQPWLYVAGSGRVLAFDEDGNAKATPGGFPGMLMPYGIAFNTHNRSLYVLDKVTESVHVFDLLGRPRAVSGTFGGLRSGSSIAFDAQTNLLCVSQTGVRAVLGCFDENGAAQPLPASLAPLAHARQVAFSGSKKSPVALHRDGSVRVHAQTGSRTVGSPAAEPSETAVAVDDRTGATFVSDSGTRAIVVLDAKGSERKRAVMTGISPQTIAFDPYARLLYAGDASVAHGITALDASLKPVKLSGTFAGMRSPHAIAIVGPSEESLRQ